MRLVAALFLVYIMVKLVEEFKKVLWLVLVYYVSYWLLLLLLVFWCQNRTPGWPTLRGDSGEIFVNLKGRLEVNIMCLTLLVDSVQPQG